MATRSYPSFALDVPAEWTDESVISWVSPAADGFSANVVVTQQRSNEPLDVYVDRQLKELRRAVKNYREITRWDLGEGRVVEHAFKTEANVAIRQLQLFVHRPPRVLVVSVSHADRAFEAHRSELESILRSVRFD